MKEEQNEVLLAQFLKDFDTGNKLALARLMVLELGLETDGEKFSMQLRKKLNRELTEQEVFMVDALQRVLRLDPARMINAG